jgi:hypothetical protein
MRYAAILRASTDGSGSSKPGAVMYIRVAMMRDIDSQTDQPRAIELSALVGTPIVMPQTYCFPSIEISTIFLSEPSGWAGSLPPVRHSL